MPGWLFPSHYGLGLVSLVLRHNRDRFPRSAIWGRGLYQFNAIGFSVSFYANRSQFDGARDPNSHILQTLAELGRAVKKHPGLPEEKYRSLMQFAMASVRRGRQIRSFGCQMMAGSVLQPLIQLAAKGDDRAT